MKIDKFDSIDETIYKAINEHIAVAKYLHNHTGTITEISGAITECYKNTGKLLLFGNGGSAADAQHFAGELVNKFRMDRQPLPAIALTTDTSVLTAISNDYGFEYIFSKQVEALCKPEDVVIGISTSGTSENVVNGMKTAKEIGATTVGFTGYDGGNIKDYADYLLNIRSDKTPRIQECHELAYHIICGLVEKKLFG